jgi:hypothetical protein
MVGGADDMDLSSDDEDENSIKISFKQQFSGFGEIFDNYYSNSQTFKQLIKKAHEEGVKLNKIWGHGTPLTDYNIKTAMVPLQEDSFIFMAGFLIEINNAIRSSLFLDLNEASKEEKDTLVERAAAAQEEKAAATAYAKSKIAIEVEGMRNVAAIWGELGEGSNPYLTPEQFKQYENIYYYNIRSMDDGSVINGVYHAGHGSRYELDYKRFAPSTMYTRRQGPGSRLGGR